jgi:hypothetical protein
MQKTHTMWINKVDNFASQIGRAFQGLLMFYAHAKWV